MLVGTSGGADSSALLLLLQSQAASLSLRLTAAYFDHQIRPPAERRAERGTVRALAALAGVRLVEGGQPVLDRARQGKRSLEEQARIDRYAFLHEAASESRCQLVAVGHTSNDQAETILLHILRGSGIRGLVGMRPSQSWLFGSGPTLVRPLLDLTRAETERYCRLRSFVPHADSLNADPSYLRNRVRHEVIPLLESLNPKARQAVLRLGRAAVAQQAFVASVARTDSLGEGTESHQAVRLSVDLLRAAPSAVQHEILAAAHASLRAAGRGLSERHLAALSDLVGSDRERSVDLPGGIVARHSQATLVLERSGPRGATRLEPLPDTRLQIPGKTRVGPWEFTAEMRDAAAVHLDGPEMAAIDASRVSEGLRVRSRRPGDRLRLAGMAGTKKVQDILVDAKVPRSQRDQVPVVCLGEEAIWVVGVRRGAEAAARSDGCRYIVMTARSEPAGV